MVVQRFKPVHFLGAIAWVTFFAGLWMYMLGVPVGRLIIPMVVSFVIGSLSAGFSLVD